MVIEIGGGVGAITKYILAANPKKFYCIEYDKRLATILSKKFHQYENFSLINEDALRLNERELIKQAVSSDELSDAKIKIVANLPYNIGTELIFKWLGDVFQYHSFTLMLQKEVVERIIATEKQPKSYGVISLLVRFFCDATKLMDVPPSCFSPQPKVDSSVVKITPKHMLGPKFTDKHRAVTYQLPVSQRRVILQEFNIFKKVVKASFANRRKKILKSFCNNLNLEKQLAITIFKQADIDYNKRAENLTFEEYLALACQYAMIDNKIYAKTDPINLINP